VSNVDLPPSGNPDIEVPCDWCTRRQISFANPPAHVSVTLWTGDLKMRNWRICQSCLDTWAKLIQFLGAPPKLDADRPD
jgi:hypothetical protein